MPVSARLASLAVEPGGQRVKLALLARRKDLLVAWLDLLEADRSTRMLGEPAGDLVWSLLEAGHAQEPSPKRPPRRMLP